MEKLQDVKIDKESTIKPMKISGPTKQKSFSIYQCKLCCDAFKGKASFIHHKEISIKYLNE